MRRFLNRMGPGEGPIRPLPDKAAQFDGSSLLTVPATADYNPPHDTDLHVVYWFSMDAFPVANDGAMINCFVNDVTKDSWFIFFERTTSRLGMGSSNGVAYSTLTFSAQAIALNTWYMAHHWWDNTGGTAIYTIDLYNVAGLINSNSTGGLFINNADPQPMRISATTAGPIVLERAKFRIDKLGIWQRPNANPVNAFPLWNSGVGMQGVDVVADVTLSNGLKGWYDLNERTGALTWRDILNQHDGAATGTINSVPPSGQF